MAPFYFQIQMRALSRSRPAPTAPSARHRGRQRRERGGPGAGAASPSPHPAVTRAGGRVLRRRRVSLAPRRSSHEAAWSWNGHHSHETQKEIQEWQHWKRRRWLRIGVVCVVSRALGMFCSGYFFYCLFMVNMVIVKPLCSNTQCQPVFFALYIKSLYVTEPHFLSISHLCLIFYDCCM